MAVRVPGEDETSFIISAIDATAAGIESAKAGIRGLSSATDDFEKRSKAQLDRMQRHWIAWSAGIYAAISTLQQAWKYAEQAAAFEEQQANLGALAARYNMTADAATNMAKEAVGGQLSMVEASQEAAKAFQMGFNPQQMAAFLTEAEKLTDVVGGDIPAAVEAMERAAATGRARALVSYGIIVDLNDALGEYAKQHGISKDAIDAHTAMQIRANAILEEARIKTRALGDAGQSTADKMNVLRATVKNIELWLGSALIRAAAAGMGAMQWLAAGVLTAYGAMQYLLWAVNTALNQHKQAAGALASARAAWKSSIEMTGKSAANIAMALSSAKELAAVMKSNAAIEGAVATGGAGTGGRGNAKAAAQKQVKEIEEVWRAAFPFAQELGRTYMEHVSGGMTEIMPEIVSDRLEITQAMLDAEYQMELENAQRKAEVWWGAAQTYISYAEQMTTYAVSMLLAEEGEREDIARRMLATTIRMLTQSLQAFMFMKAKEHLANALASAGMIKSRQAQATTDMSIGATMAAAWAAYYTAHSLNPYGGQAFIPAATAMTAAIAGFSAATAGVNAAAIAGIATELSLAAAWAAGGILVGGIGEALAEKIESGGNATTTSSYSQSYTMPSGGTQTTTTETETPKKATIVNVTVNGSFFGDRAELAREIAAEVDKAKADGVH